MGTTEEKPASAGSKSFFDVLFVGPFCFKKEERVAVMPDGRQPGSDIQAHEPFLVVDPKDVNTAGTTGWNTNDPARTAKGIYTFSTCTIDITKATTEGVLETSQHDADVPLAVVLDSSFAFEGGAGVITTIKLGQGTLEFLRRPDRPSSEQGIGTVSRLRVQHDGDVIVTVHVEGEENARVLALKPGSDVAIVNGFLTVDSSKTGDAHQLFGKITESGTFTPGESAPSLNDLPVIGGNYEVFKINLPFLVPPVGCCPPP